MSDRTICYYVTGHGYGHATRVIGQVSYLLTKGYTVHVVSGLDPKFFYNNIGNILETSSASLSDRLICHRRVLDAGAVQLDPLHIDVLQTLENYRNDIHNNYSDLKHSEILFLQEHKANLVLVDVTPLPLAAAKEIGIPSVIVSNFTWDVTYQYLFDIVKESLHGDDKVSYHSMIDQCNQDVCSAGYYLRLPGITPLPTTYNGKVIPGPLICRKALNDREIVRARLNINDDVKVLVLGFGGFKLSFGSISWTLKDEMLPHGWICLVLGSEGESMASDRFIAMSRDAYVPDIINASDAVLGKLGYGTVSECLRHGVPLLYVPRTDWPEEEHLSKFIMSYDAGIRITEEEFFKGNWEQYLLQALEKKLKGLDISELNPDGAHAEIETTIKGIIEKTI